MGPTLTSNPLAETFERKNNHQVIEMGTILITAVTGSACICCAAVAGQNERRRRRLRINLQVEPGLLVHAGPLRQTVPAPATSLPPNWIAKVIQPADLDKIPWLEDKDVGEILYRNTETKETTWEKPADNLT